ASKRDAKEFFVAQTYSFTVEFANNSCITPSTFKRNLLWFKLCVLPSRTFIPAFVISYSSIKEIKDVLIKDKLLGVSRANGIVKESTVLNIIESPLLSITL